MLADGPRDARDGGADVNHQNDLLWPESEETLRLRLYRSSEVSAVGQDGVGGTATGCKCAVERGVLAVVATPVETGREPYGLRDRAADGIRR